MAMWKTREDIESMRKLELQVLL